MLLLRRLSGRRLIESSPRKHAQMCVGDGYQKKLKPRGVLTLTSTSSTAATNNPTRLSLLNNSDPCKDVYVAEKSLGGRISPDEELLSLNEAAKMLLRVDGRKVSTCALWRWARRGLRGVQLDYCRVGRKLCTTRGALRRFFSELAELDERSSPDARSPPRFLRRRPITSRQRQRALAEADTILKRARI